MKRDLLALINQEMPGFSKGQKLIGKFIVNHYDKAAFMTAFKLGSTVGVSESTVVRFATELGYNGYPQLQRSLQELIRNRLTSVQRMEVTTEQIGDNDIFSRVMNSDIEKLKHTLEESSQEDFQSSVNSLLNAKRIYILGVRSSSALASFLYFYFNHIFDNVKLINSASTGEMFEQIFRIDKDDVFIGISFPRYSKRTIKAIDFAKERGATVIALTDVKSSPIAQNANYTLLARSDMASFVDSLVAPMSIVNALIVAIGIKKKTEISDTYSLLEKIWDEYDIYDKSEDNTPDDEKI